ncbi:hypothetical protein BKA70DRAFT_1091725 [Coprinopsis sp. MPI-PUGE-AT-0042]|nr:hypothetical protein BKA70DRAFT_1091725 [Coprinopsis sp. MPI-PUGE-AT-0042]
MDKPNGPRQQPPDKRNAAYETIFGRPGVHHHQQGYPQNMQPPYPQFPPPQPQAQAYPYRQQSHFSNPDSRTSFGSSYSGYQQYPPNMGQPPPPQLGPQGPYRQAYPPVVPQQPYNGFDYPANYSPSPPQIQTPFSYSGSLGLPPNPQLGRARSVISNGSGQIMGSPMPLYQEPPDAIQASSSQPSLTPAQAYQNQVYARHQPSPGPLQQQADWNRHRTSPAGQVHRRSSLAHSTARMSEAPRLGISLEQDEGRLGLDFGVNGSGSSDQGTDADSELPYARDDYSGTRFLLLS